MRRALGVSPAELVHELPLKVARATRRTVLQTVNRGITPLRDRAYGRRVREALARAGRDPWVLVVVPYVLHYAVPCLRLAAPHVPVVLVLNGTRAWEERILAEQFPDTPRIELRPVSGSMLAHNVVLDVLLRHADRDLGLLDPDLYVFEPAVFGRLALGPGEVAAGAFGFHNRKANLVFPTTHLLRLDVRTLQELMQRHRIRPIVYHRTPPHLVAPLASLGLGDHNFPKEYLSNYDTLNLLMAVALSERLRLRVLDVTEQEAVHFGGVTYEDRSSKLDYLTQRMLALPSVQPFAERYRAALVGNVSPEKTLGRLHAAGQGKFVGWVDQTVDRLTSRGV